MKTFFIFKDSDLLNNILKFLWDVIKSLLLPVGLFVAGMIASNQIGANQKQIESTQMVNYFNNIVNFTQKVTNSQIVEYYNCINRIDNYDLRNTLVVKKIGLPETLYSNIDKQKLFEAYNIGDDSIMMVNYLVVIANMNTLIDQNNHLQELDDDYASDINIKLNDLWLVHKEIVERLEYYERLRTGKQESVLLLDDNQKELIKKLYTVYKLEYSKPTVDDINYMHKFMLQIHDIINEEYNNYIRHMFFDSVESAIQLHSEIDDLLSTHKNNLLVIANTLTLTSESIKKPLNTLNNSIE